LHDYERGDRKDELLHAPEGVIGAAIELSDRAPAFHSSDEYDTTALLTGIRGHARAQALVLRDNLREATKRWGDINSACVKAANAFVNAHLELGFVDDDDDGVSQSGVALMSHSEIAFGVTEKLVRRADRCLANMVTCLDQLADVYITLADDTRAWSILLANAANVGGERLVTVEPVLPGKGVALDQFLSWSEEVSAMFRKELVVKNVVCDIFETKSDSLTRSQFEMQLSVLLLEAFVDSSRLALLHNLLQAQCE
jgi:hypothetical protein